jgi:hypothetical protein
LANDPAGSSVADSDSRLAFHHRQPLPIFNRRPAIVDSNSKVAALSTSTVLTVPPQRYPPRSEGSDVAIVESKKALAKVKSESGEPGQQVGLSSGQNVETPPENRRQPRELLIVNSNGLESAKKPSGGMRAPVPFFEWRTRSSNFQNDNPARPAARVSSTIVTSDPQQMDDNLHSISGSATGILQHIDHHICESRHFDASSFPWKAEEWDKLEGKCVPDIQTLLNDEKGGVSLHGGDGLQEARDLLNSKYDLCSIVRGLLQCLFMMASMTKESSGSYGALCTEYALPLKEVIFCQIRTYSAHC